MEYNGNEIYATRYMKSLFLFGRRWIGYFRLYLTGVRYFCMRSMVSVSLPPCLRYGLHIYDNPVGVLTNNPPFPQQMFQLNNYMYLSPKQPRNTFCENLALDAYSRGMGGLGLPGDLSSSSRFVRVAFTKVNAISGESEEESVSQFFHILGSVDQQRGCCEVADGKYEITLYTSCCNVTKGIYYYNTYENHQISAVDMHVENLDSDKMICYPVIQGERINYQNK